MEIIWSPVLDPAAARWQALARDAAQQGESDDAASSLRDSGLLKLVRIRRQDAAPLPLATVLSVLEILAVPRLMLARQLAAAVVAETAAARLRTDEGKGARLAGGAAVGLLLPMYSVDDAEPTIEARAEQRGWRLSGQGRWMGQYQHGAAFLLFAATVPARGADNLSAFVVPGSILELGATEDSGDAVQANRFQCDVALRAGHMLGRPGTARAAMRQAAVLCRLTAAAQAVGLGLAAYELARGVMPRRAPGDTPGPAAHQLAGCATAISAARALLYEAVRGEQAGRDAGLTSVMALLSASECAERAIQASRQIVGDGAPGMQALLQASQVQQADVGPSRAHAALLAGRILPSVSATPGVPIMARNANTRSAESPGRVAEILDAAAAAFTQYSYDATTLDQIGDALGVSKGSIYYHYRSKADLWVAVYRRAMEMNIDAITPIARQAGVRALDRLYRMAHAHSLQVMKHLSYQRVAVQGLEAHLMGRVSEEQRASLAEVISLRDHYEELFVSVLTQAIEAGELPRQNPRLSIKPLFGAINWTTMWYQPRPGETAADRDALASRLATFVLSGLTQSYEPVAELPAAIHQPNTH